MCIVGLDIPFSPVSSKHQRQTVLPSVFKAVAKAHRIRSNIIHFTYKLLSEKKKFWVVHYGLYNLETDTVRECDARGNTRPGSPIFSSVWELVRKNHWTGRGQSCVPWIIFFGYSAAAFISQGEKNLSLLSIKSVNASVFCRVSHAG
jgi:hypothetical protein